MTSFDNASSQTTLSLFSPAKINLFLHITGKRTDGYHNLQTVFRLLDWGDTLDFTLSAESFEVASVNEASNALPALPTLPIVLNCDVTLTNEVTDNLIVKSALSLLQWLHNETRRPTQNAKIKPLASHLPVITVDLHKVLPMGAGLGGGSSNAATTLIALNKLWQLELDMPTLITIGKSIGADVPIFLFGQDAIAESIGERLTPITLPPMHYLILNPTAHISTQALFKHTQLNRSVDVISHETIVSQQDHFLTHLTLPYQNVFEPVVVSTTTEVATALHYLRSLEPIAQATARMTGTGSSVFLPIPQAKLTDIESYICNEKQPPCHAVLTTSYSNKP